MSGYQSLSAAELALALGGHRNGGGWMAKCPAHDDRSPSLAIDKGLNGCVLLYCFAGCTNKEVIAALKARGLWPGTSESAHRHGHSLEPKNMDRPKQDDQLRTDHARRIWRSSRQATGSPVAEYLNGRGIHIEPPKRLRCHPALAHNPSRGKWPAMVAAVQRGIDGAFLGVHRTYLTDNGSLKAPITPNKMMLGPCRGGAVRLAPISEHLMVDEGIETCLSAIQASGLPAWAAMSTSGMKALNLPDEVHQVTILADGDEAGETAAVNSAQRWIRQGKLVKIARPPRGLDFNDVLLGKAGEPMEGNHDY